MIEFKDFLNIEWLQTLIKEIQSILVLPTCIVLTCILIYVVFINLKASLLLEGIITSGIEEDDIEKLENDLSMKNGYQISFFVNFLIPLSTQLKGIAISSLATALTKNTIKLQGNIEKAERFLKYHYPNVKINWCINWKWWNCKNKDDSIEDNPLDIIIKSYCVVLE